MKYKIKPINSPVLATWKGLNKAVMSEKNEATLLALLALEKSGRHRKMFMLRIQSRVNRLRAKRELSALIF